MAEVLLRTRGEALLGGRNGIVQSCSLWLAAPRWNLLNLRGFAAW